MSFLSRLFGRRRQQVTKRPDHTPFHTTPFGNTAVDLVGPFSLRPPATSERYTDFNHAVSAARDARVEQLFTRICQINNANVVNNLGSHIEDYSRTVAPLTDDEEHDIRTLKLGVQFHVHQPALKGPKP